MEAASASQPVGAMQAPKAPPASWSEPVVVEESAPRGHPDVGPQLLDDQRDRQPDTFTQTNEAPVAATQVQGDSNESQFSKRSVLPASKYGDRGNRCDYVRTALVEAEKQHEKVVAAQQTSGDDELDKLKAKDFRCVANSPGGWRYRRWLEEHATEQEKIEWGKANRKQQELMRAKWLSQKHSEKMTGQRELERYWEIDEEIGTMHGYWKIVEEEGGSHIPDAIARADSIVEYCSQMGGRWVEWNQQAKDWDFRHLKKVDRVRYERAWELFEECSSRLGSGGGTGT